MADRLSTSLQESILSLLATNDAQGRIAAGLLTAGSFDESYRDIAGRVIDYHRQHGKAPGKAHLDDLLDDVLGNPEHKKFRQYMRVLEGIFSQAPGLNGTYLLTRINEFSRKQQLKAAIMEASELYGQGGDDLVSKVEEVMINALKFQEHGFDSGTFLNDKTRALRFLDEQVQPYLTGIPELDRVNMGPTPGKMLLFLGPKGKGKSWWGIHSLKRCLMQGAMGMHITLEMPEEEVSQRYFQSYMGMTKRSDPFDTTKFELDKLNRVVGFKSESNNPVMSLDNPKVRTWLGKRMNDWGTRLGRLVIKEFPPSYLTVPKLEAYLDMMELTHKFIPNAMTIDYPDLMLIKGTEHRIALGETYKDIRGLLRRRNIAGIIPTQTSRTGWDAATVKASMVGEDATKIMTADMTMTYSQTEEEHLRGLARLGVAHNRGDEDGFNILISQNYTAGQFCISSARMPRGYFDMLKIDPKKAEGEDDG